jgi:gamma-glutamylcyclotransferase (GGCT)/AIG2-like uncharacterized protein YtfP
MTNDPSSHPRTFVFVYGTLKRGFINEPAMRGVGSSSVRKALVRGVALYHLPNPGRTYPYPALLRGQGMALGELHVLESHDALLVLDHLELEGFEYHRVPCWVTMRGVRLRAWVYVYASRRHLHRRRARRYPGVWWRADVRPRSNLRR